MASKLVRRTPDSTPSHRPTLEQLEDRCLPSANVMIPMGMAPPPMNVQPMGRTAIASLSHDQLHALQSQFQQQAAIAAIVLEVDQVALAILQQFAPQTPQFRPVIANLTSAILAQQAAAQTFQNQFNLLNQLDALQDQALILSAEIQIDTSLVRVLQQFRAVQTANNLQSVIARDQAAVQALQPQIAAVEQQVSTFV
jgi:hypothetical protein